MPQLGLTMEEGTIGKWHKKVGDKITKGEILLDIETDKITTEIESEYEGVLLQIVAAEGEEVPVQGIIALIGEEGETVGAPPQSQKQVKSEEVQEAPVQMASKEQTQGKTASGRIKISPLAKKTAEKKGVDYTALEGSGPGGRIIQRDILAAFERGGASDSAPVTAVPTAEQSSDAPAKSVLPLKGMRKIIAERMLQSHLQIPPVTQNMKIDVTALLSFREEVNKNRDKRFSINDFILKAVSKALKQNKHIMVSLTDEGILQHEEVNIGMAVATESGLIVPVIKNADKMSLEAIAETAKDLAERARDNKLDVSEYKGSTFTISNLGMYGVESFTPIINQPDAAILGVCSVESELCLENGSVAEKKVMRISMTYDHRLLDGAIAAKFQIAVKRLLENPIDILL